MPFTAGTGVTATSIETQGVRLNAMVLFQIPGA
jgi:hypothetical protein